MGEKRNDKKIFLWVIVILMIGIVVLICLLFIPKNVENQAQAGAKIPDQTKELIPTESQSEENTTEMDCREVLDFVLHNLSDKGIEISDYQDDLIFNFGGFLLTSDQYEEPIVGEGTPKAWYSLGGVGSCLNSNYADYATYTDGKLTDFDWLDNHSGCRRIASFSTEKYSGCIYQYEMELFTAAELATMQSDINNISGYWVFFLSESMEKPVNIVFFNRDYFSKDEAYSAVGIKDETDSTTNIALGDIDQNGVEDYILMEQSLLEPLWEDKYYFRWTFVFNNEEIYTGYDELNCGFKADFCDLDEDKKEEIFVIKYPYVNSMPLETFVTLKKTEEGWIELANSSEYHVNEGDDCYGNNAFPIHGNAGKDNSAIIEIICDGYGSIEVDTTEHYEELIEELDAEGALGDLYQYANTILYDNKHKSGELIAQTSAWGIWNLRIDEVDGKNCIVATHGLENKEFGKYDTLGKVNIYFNYNTLGEIQILKMDFEPLTLIG